MKAISFLGLNNYQETTYAFGSKQHTTRFFAVALAHFFSFETIFVCVTPKVEIHVNWSSLQSELQAANINFIPIKIKDGGNETELWETFGALTSSVEDGDNIVFDITNSYRSLPMLCMLAAIYLRVTRNVTLEALIYGAFDARDMQTNISPVFDLTPFVALLDWTSAADQFIRTGNAYDLAKRLRAGRQSSDIHQGNLQAQQLDQQLEQLSSAMEQVSLALRMSRPLETMKASAALVDALGNSRTHMGAIAHPFELLTKRLMQTYTPFALDAPDQPPQWPENLMMQLELIQWYRARDHIVQAVTLAREFVVSLVCYHAGKDMQIPDERKRIEGALNGSQLGANLPTALQSFPDAGELLAIWKELTTVRNTLAHAAVTVGSKPAEELLEQFDKLLDGLKKIVPQLSWWQK